MAVSLLRRIGRLEEKWGLNKKGLSIVKRGGGSWWDSLPARGGAWW